MLTRKRSAHKNTANIGKLFFYISLLIVIGFLVFSFA